MGPKKRWYATLTSPLWRGVRCLACGHAWSCLPALATLTGSLVCVRCLTRQQLEPA